MSHSFNNPSAHYRARPFWSWNTEVTPEKVRSQIQMFRDMGMGGFVIHSRNGLRTEYMGKHYLDMVKLSVEYAEALGLKVWIYDEDRWPSGNSGGKVTSDRRFRQRSLVVTTQRPPHLGRKEHNEDYLVAAYRLQFDDNGNLRSYSLSADGDGDIFAYVHIEDDNPRYNGQSNVDVLNRSAIKKFIENTYEVYYNVIGEHFGKTVEAFFTDEPQGTRALYAEHSDLSLFRSAQIMWTDDFPETYRKQYGETLIEHIPAILWESENSARVRYRYHEHCAARFKEAYTEQIGAWCETHGVAFTGHFICEDSLGAQTTGTKDVMRCYADQQIPGIDVLQGKFELITAMQCRSVARQYGKKRVMSELYGVNNWDTPLRELFHQGNWQAAMGINVRIPHLSWMSMLGEGKRDYPATFGYQSPWYLDAKILEDYFARLHSVLENGAPRVQVGVIHPIESYWTVSGPADKTARLCAERDRELSTLFEWLSFDGIDFDFINEALLPHQLRTDGGKTRIGNMQYKAILIPNCITLRSTTLKALEQLQNSGVQIIFAGDIPTLSDGIESSAAIYFAKRCQQVSFTHGGISSALEEFKAFSLTGEHTEDYLFADVDYEDARWLFLAPARKVEKTEDTTPRPYTLKLRGNVTPRIYHAMTGECSTPVYRYSEDSTTIFLSLYPYQTLFLRLESKKTPPVPEEPCDEFAMELPFESTVSYARVEDNVILLDRAEYSLDGTHYEPAEEILHLDTLCRARLRLSSLTGKLSPQPWSVKDECAHTLYLRFTFDSEVELPCKLAYERAKRICMNGKEIPLCRTGFYVDEDISVVTLPDLLIGKNVIDAEIEIGKTNGAEPMYLLGDFNVRLTGINATVTVPSQTVAFGSVVHQGMPFYGGSLIYRTEVMLEKNGDLRVTVNHYRCALVKIFLDGIHTGNIILPPYAVEIPNVCAGKHTLELVAVGNRHNTFGSLHWGIEDPYYGPAHWHKYGDAYSREYRLREFGIMKCPIVQIKIKK